MAVGKLYILNRTITDHPSSNTFDPNGDRAYMRALLHPGFMIYEGVMNWNARLEGNQLHFQSQYMRGAEGPQPIVMALGPEGRDESAQARIILKSMAHNKCRGAAAALCAIEGPNWASIP